MNNAIKKIVIIGPESTGKSSLCEALALHYKTIWCKEYAREYLLHNGTSYNYENLLTIAKGQLVLEKNAILEVQKLNINKKLLFVDTDMLVMKTWCEFVFNKCYNFILQEAAKKECNLYLLCNIDLPWTKDELREYPDLKIREKLFLHYKELAIESNVDWALISGSGNQRTNNAIAAIEKHLSK